MTTTERLGRLLRGKAGRMTLLVAAQLLVVFGWGVPHFNGEAEGNARQWLAADIAHFQADTPLAISPALDSAGPDLKQRLQQQYRQVRERAAAHLEIMIFYYARYYMAISLTAFTGILAAVALLFISKQGWAASSPYLVAVFITMTSLAGLFGAFPAMFEQASNIDENKKSYTAYVALENRILSYAASGSDEDGKDRTAASFVHLVDARLRDLHRLPVALNPEAIPDPTESLKQGSTAQ